MVWHGTVQAAVAKALLKLNCIPVFLSEKLTHQCYYRYCKGVLWPVRVPHSLVTVLRIAHDYPSNLCRCPGRLNIDILCVNAWHDAPCNSS